MRYLAEQITKDIIMTFLKNLLATVLNFTTGLGFYGLGLLGVSALFFFLGFAPFAWGFLGAFLFRNYERIVDYIKETV